MTKRQINMFLYTAQGIGAIFVGIFLVAYFGGLIQGFFGELPLTTTLNSEPIFIVSQSLIGGILIVLLIVAIIFSTIYLRKD